MSMKLDSRFDAVASSSHSQSQAAARIRTGGEASARTAKATASSGDVAEIETGRLNAAAAGSAADDLEALVGLASAVKEQLVAHGGPAVEAQAARLSPDVATRLLVE